MAGNGIPLESVDINSCITQTSQCGLEYGAHELRNSHTGAFTMSSK